MEASGGAWDVLLDDEDGTALAARPVHRSARGSWFPTNPVLDDPGTTELLGLVDGEALEGARADVRWCTDWVITDGLLGTRRCDAHTRHAQPDAAGDFLYEPDPAGEADPFAESHLYAQVDTVRRWYEGLIGLPWTAPIRVYGGFAMSNAFYGDFDADGVADISFGRGQADVDFGYDGDVVVHELGHAVNDRLGDLGWARSTDQGLDWTGGAAEEGFADAWTLLRTGDPLVGEYAGIAFDRPAIRDLSVPLRCDAHRVGQSHRDGQLVGHLVWTLLEDGAVSPEVLGPWLALAVARITPDSDWDAIGGALADAAVTLVADGTLDDAGLDAIVEAIAAVGLPGCATAVRVTSGQPRPVYLFHPGLKSEPFAEVVAGIDHQLVVPEGAGRVTVRITGPDTEDLGLGWTLYGRVDQPVQVEPVTDPALGLGGGRAVAWDTRVEGASREVVVRWPVVPPGVPAPPGTLRPGQTLHLSLAARDLGTMPVLSSPAGFAMLEVTAQSGAASPGACAHTGPWPWTSWAGLLAVGAVLRRRRG